ASDIFSSPLHPYTKGLLACIPEAGVDYGNGARRLYSIPGTMPDASRLPSGCVFAPRCRLAEPKCSIGNDPELADAGEGRLCRCRRWKEG
ncbi:MAG: dipeptide ABC transporter ATP-binding protein DppD, partial [Planctomycetota bacterium]|nr:dipeptide ABC transporter ATP-binding protein DppD [Planctomycetota bacterium]